MLTQSRVLRSGLCFGLSIALLGGVLVACSSTPLSEPAPIEDRSLDRSGQSQSTAPAPISSITPSAPAASEAGPTPPGFYRVQKGDTLIGIARKNNVSRADLQTWNKLDNPNQIEVGQLVRVQPPLGETPAAVESKPVIIGKPLQAASLPRPTASASTPASVPVPPAPIANESINVTGKGQNETVENLGLSWSWPAPGKVVGGFNEKNRGIEIAGKRGDPVYSAANGRVAIAGVVLPNYGKLVIIKHNENLLTAYGFLDQVKVTEGELVRRGQVIATMGADGTSAREQLHFEVRRSGKPIDPLDVLPK